MACRSSLSTALCRSWRPRFHHYLPFSTNAHGVSYSVEPVGKRRSARKIISFILFSVTGGFVLSAIDDFAVYHKCSSKALEKVINDKSIREALGEPITRGAWYNASLAVVNKKSCASCTFPIIGPQGNGILQVKAISHGENDWHDYLPGYRQWEILFLEALVHTPTDEANTRTFRIDLVKNPSLHDVK